VDDSVIMGRHLYQRGLHAIHNNQWDQAESALARAVKACPDDQRVRRHYADTLWRRGATDQAIGEMETAVELSGGEPSLMVELGRMYLLRGQLGDAFQQANLAVQRDRRLADAWALRSDVLRQQGKTQEALDSYHRALSYSPGDERLELEIAELYRQLNRPRRALLVLQGMTNEYEPGNEPPQLLYLQGLALKELGRHRDALERFRRAQPRGQPTVDLLCQLAELELLSGDLASARRSTIEAVRRGADREATDALFARIAAAGPRLSTGTR
jgi:Flp pilus assembly protein TadD